MRGEQVPAWKGESGRSPVTTTEAAATSRASGYRHRTTAGLMGDAPLQVKRGRKRRARSTVKKAAPIQKPVIALRTQKEKVQASCRRGSSPLKLLAACRRWRLEADSLTRCRAACAPAAVSASQRCAEPSETRENEEAARCTCRYAGVPAPATAPSRRRRLRAVSLLATAARSGLAQVDSVANSRCA